MPLDLLKTRPYDLRHSLAVFTHAAVGGDVESTRRLLGVSPATALHYAAGALDPLLTAAVARLEGIVGRKPDTRTGHLKKAKAKRR